MARAFAALDAAAASGSKTRLGAYQCYARVQVAVGDEGYAGEILRGVKLFEDLHAADRPAAVELIRRLGMDDLMQALARHAGMLSPAQLTSPAALRGLLGPAQSAGSGGAGSGAAAGGGGGGGGGGGDRGGGGGRQLGPGKALATAIVCGDTEAADRLVVVARVRDLLRPLACRECHAAGHLAPVHALKAPPLVLACRCRAPVNNGTAQCLSTQYAAVDRETGALAIVPPPHAGHVGAERAQGANELCAGMLGTGSTTRAVAAATKIKALLAGYAGAAPTNEALKRAKIAAAEVAAAAWAEAETGVYAAAGVGSSSGGGGGAGADAGADAEGDEGDEGDGDGPVGDVGARDSSDEHRQQEQQQQQRSGGGAAMGFGRYTGGRTPPSKEGGQAVDPAVRAAVTRHIALSTALSTLTHLGAEPFLLKRQCAAIGLMRSLDGLELCDLIAGGFSALQAGEPVVAALVAGGCLAHARQSAHVYANACLGRMFVWSAGLLHIRLAWAHDAGAGGSRCKGAGGGGVGRDGGGGAAAAVAAAAAATGAGTDAATAAAAAPVAGGGQWSRAAGGADERLAREYLRLRTPGSTLFGQPCSGTLWFAGYETWLRDRNDKNASRRNAQAEGCEQILAELAVRRL